MAVCPGCRILRLQGSGMNLVPCRSVCLLQGSLEPSLSIQFFLCLGTVGLVVLETLYTNCHVPSVFQLMSGMSHSWSAYLRSPVRTWSLELVPVKHFSTAQLPMLSMQEASMWLPETRHRDGLTSVSWSRWWRLYVFPFSLCCGNSF